MEDGGANAGKVGEFTEGCRLYVTTTLGEELEGEVLTFDKVSNCVVLQDVGNSGGKRNLRFLRMSFIKDFKAIGRSEEAANFQIPELDLQQLRVREEAAVRQAEIETDRIGIGVSQEAQELFDALSKTLPVRWDKSTIVVLDDVRVSSPHKPENVTGGSPAANDRVKKMLEHHWRRIQERPSN